MKSIMLYRDGSPDDLAALRTLGIASYGTLRNEMTEANWKKMETIINSDDTFPVLLQNCLPFVCVSDNKVVGMAFLVLSGNPTKIYSPQTSYIRMVGVDPQFSGKGIAQTLVQTCIDRAKEEGEKIISLHSAEVMYAARHVYEKLGFQKIRMLDAHYGLAYWLYQMNLD